MSAVRDHENPSEIPRRIALFGGTFDPVHAGHIHIAARAREAMALNEVRFIPCRISPHKTGSIPTPAEDRVEILRLSLAGKPWAVVDTRELDRPPPSYSWQTAESFRAEFPAADLFWLMGADQWAALPRWSHPEKIATCVEFIVFTRNGEVPEPRAGFILHSLDAIHPASSTAIREEIRTGKSPAWMAESALEHIASRRLYKETLR